MTTEEAVEWPTPCTKCGGDRVWHRGGIRRGIQILKARCNKCRSNGLGYPQKKTVNAAVNRARSREKAGGAAALNKIWESKNPGKARAHKIVERHLKLGNIRKKPCERCGSLDAHAHHEDYSIPLEVMWLCPLHHKERHKEIEFAKAVSSPALSDSQTFDPSASGSHFPASGAQLHGAAQ